MEIFRWVTTYSCLDNGYIMQDYLDNHLPNCFNVIFKDGNYAEIQHLKNGKIWGVMACSDGCVFNHKVEFEFIH